LESEDLELPSAKDGTRRSITDLERKQILKLAETHYAGLWVKMTLYCGLRPSEARALDWRHIDLKERLVHVEQSMKARTTIIDNPKTPAGVRDVPIPDIFIEDLRTARRGLFEPVFRKDNRPPAERETQPAASGRHDRSSMARMWNSFKRELNITNGATLERNQIIIAAIADDLVPYCLRHTYGTDLQSAGVPINVAKYLMGHSDISVTANIYTHTTADIIKDAASMINKKQASQ
jgi:integrase